MTLPPGAVPVLVLYMEPNGNLGVSGPVNDVPATFELLGKVALVLAAHHAQLAKQAGPSLVIAKEAPAMPKELQGPLLNGNGNHPPLRRI